MTLQSEQINELMTALAKAQGSMTHAKKDSTNPHFKSNFADLASVWIACRQALSENDLAVAQTLDIAGEKSVLVTILGHKSGQWIKSIIPLPIQRPGPQEMGSCISYCRRYALASMVGVYQDDDDGEAAAKPYRADPVLTKEQMAILETYFTSFPDSPKGICDKFGIKDVSELPQANFSYVLNVLKKRMLAKENGDKAHEN